MDKANLGFEDAKLLNKNASHAVADAIQETFKNNIPIVYSKDGKIYKEYSNGTIEECSREDDEFSAVLPVLGYDHYDRKKIKLPTLSGFKILRIFAGPNGSGKTTIYEYIANRYESGIFINADEIEEIINKTGELDLKHYKIESSVDDVNDCMHSTSWNDVPIGKSCIEKMIVKKSLNIEICSESVSYSAAILAEIIRDLLVREGKHFSFETVMSHPSKIDFIQKAIGLGYKCYLYYICTESPIINFERILSRSKLGGHYVPEELIKKRYYGSLSLLNYAIQKSFRAFIFDNSNKIDYVNNNLPVNTLCLEYQEGNLKHNFKNVLPNWVSRYVLGTI